MKMQEARNPKLFNESDELSKEAESALMKVADEFVSKCQKKSIDVVLDDIVLVGSNAGFFYDRWSDLDLHFIVRSGDIEALRDICKEMNDKGHLYKGMSVECYAQTPDEQNRSQNIYSLLNGWKRREAAPVHSSKPLMPDVESNVKQWSERIKATKTKEEAKELLEELKQLRKRGLMSGDGETSSENIIFKELRRDGSIKKLYAKAKDSQINDDWSPMFNVGDAFVAKYVDKFTKNYWRYEITKLPSSPDEDYELEGRHYFARGPRSNFMIVERDEFLCSERDLANNFRKLKTKRVIFEE